MKNKHTVNASVVVYVLYVHSWSEGCDCPLTRLLLSCSMLRVYVCSLTLARVSCFYIIDGHKLIAMSQCHIHHRLVIQDYVCVSVCGGGGGGWGRQL